MEGVACSCTNPPYFGFLPIYLTPLCKVLYQSSVLSDCLIVSYNLRVIRKLLKVEGQWALHEVICLKAEKNGDRNIHMGTLVRWSADLGTFPLHLVQGWLNYYIWLNSTYLLFPSLSVLTQVISFIHICKLFSSTPPSSAYRVLIFSTLVALVFLLSHCIYVQVLAKVYIYRTFWIMPIDCTIESTYISLMHIKISNN